MSGKATGRGELVDPVLEGSAGSDYERYLRTEDLLRLQKPPEERAHRDELLFQVTHQSSELWLKLAAAEVAEATSRIEHREVAAATRLLRRATLAIGYLTDQLGMLEELSPWEYQEIRKVLGHGSGFDSPGFVALRRLLHPLERAFEAEVARAGLDLVELYVEGGRHEQLYQLAEALVSLDAGLQLWRARHHRVVVRVIGDGVVGTQGTPVEVLGCLVAQVAFPRLWEVRNELTARSVGG